MHILKFADSCYFLWRFAWCTRMLATMREELRDGELFRYDRPKFSRSSFCSVTVPTFTFISEKYHLCVVFYVLVVLEAFLF